MGYLAEILPTLYKRVALRHCFFATDLRRPLSSSNLNVCFGSIASVPVCWPHVRCYPDSDRNSDLRARRLSAKSGREQSQQYSYIAANMAKLTELLTKNAMHVGQSLLAGTLIADAVGFTRTLHSGSNCLYLLWRYLT
jgi:hypothetical protein